MVISRTPFRVSFFGGGTDYPVWYRENGGSVISTTINKYCYLSCRYLPPFFDYNYRVRYYYNELVKAVDDIKHPSVRACIKKLGIISGLDIVHNADLPAQSGLGSSSTFTVGLLNALYALDHYMPTKRELALEAINIEQNILKENVGSQDQTAAAFGSFNRIRFGGGQEVAVEQIIIPPGRLSELQGNLLLFFTGFTRNADSVAAEQIKATPQKTRELLCMLDLVDQAQSILLSKSESLDAFGKLLHEQWKIKRSLSSLISNSCIDEIYDSAIRAGALGGKLLGAGSGGFILFYCPTSTRKKVKDALSRLLHVPFRFEHTGSQIVYYSHSEDYEYK
jgi:D-glycero-alpha-D-manno-heptose-7-phosphate kinase